MRYRKRTEHIHKDINSNIVGVSSDLQGEIDLNTIHRSSTGENHTYIDQDVRTTGSPTFVNITFTGTLGFTLGTTINEISIDGTMVGNSDDAVPTEKAIVSYITAVIAALSHNDLADIGIKTHAEIDTHIGSSGVDHTYIDQDVKTTASPTYDDLDLTGSLDLTADTETIQFGGVTYIRIWDGSDAIAFGQAAGTDVQGCTYIGYKCGDSNVGTYFTGIGRNCGALNLGNYFAGVGREVGYYGVGKYFVGMGYKSGYRNAGEKNTAIGHDSFSNWTDDSGSAVTFDNTDVTVVDNQITVTAHGLGAVDYYILLKFTEGTSELPGLSDGSYQQYKVIDVDTVEVISDTITGAGTGTGHTLTPKVIYENSTALGYNAEPTASNQIMLGDANVTEVYSHGACNFDSGNFQGGLTIKELSADPSDPAEGTSTIWQSDGTATGDDGDILMKITAGGVTKTATLIDFSAI